MFLKQTLFAALLLVGIACAIAIGLSLFPVEVALAPEPTVVKTIPFKQTRLNVRRDIYGHHAEKPAHAILRCREAELTYDMLTNEIVEHINGLDGEILHEGLQDSFTADIATYNHQQRQITASLIKGFRHQDEKPSLQGEANYAEMWITPKGLVFDAKMVRVHDGKPAPLTMEALSASYRNATLQLNGRVAIGLNAMGNLIADKAVIDPHKGEGDFSGNLSVLMASGAKLHADHCHVNQNDATAIFTASDKVSYRDLNFEAKKPLELTCQQLTVHAPNHGVSEIIAKGEVEAIYDHGWELSADRATYHSGPDKRLVVDADQQDGCIVTTPYNDNLIAKRIESILADNLVTFYELSGELRDGQTTLQADEATWNHHTSILTCSKETQIQNPKHGFLHANGDLQVTFQTGDTGLALATAQHQGALTIHGTDKQLVCQGNCLIEHQNKQITLTADEDTPIRYKDATGQLDALKLFVWYDWHNQNFAPTKLVAEKQVRLQRSNEGSHQLALADELIYLPDQEKITLTSHSPNRVLYYDPSRQMTASAKGVDISRDARTRKMTLQGKGDVQFKLMEAELQAMKQYLQGIENGKK